MGLDKEAHESVSNDANEGQKQGAAADARLRNKQAAGQKYNLAGTLDQWGRRIGTEKGTQSAMRSQAREQAKQDEKPKFRKQTVITKDEPYQPGM